MSLIRPSQNEGRILFTVYGETKLDANELKTDVRPIMFCAKIGRQGYGFRNIDNLIALVIQVLGPQADIVG